MDLLGNEELKNTAKRKQTEDDEKENLEPSSRKQPTLRNCINSLLHDHNIDKLCLYVEPKLKELIKKGNLYDDRELVIKVIFHALLLDIPNHFVDTEVPINVYEVKRNNNFLYADLLIVEIKSTENSKRNRFIFEFKNKGVNFLDLQIKGNNSSWEVMERKAYKVEAMSRRDVLQLKCNNLEKFNHGKTMREIFNGAREQLLNYVRNLKKDDHQNNFEFITSAFVVMAVGSRKLIWEKISC
ncbi:16181_t:CDS:2 [Funneliformis caledonium]|uniref:16181_t:CDS:1 n=1 Tax=Funneliformis caledonium TaxID=1117310 RepID=A0A9N9F9N4_9GLOM|nr:16181_t:CDS:2 [Funneliformis caledonium]